MAESETRRAGGESALERWFQITARGSSVRTEVVAGLTTFFVMAYIIFVNPAILSGGPLEGQGPPFAATVTATCLAAGLMSIAMGLFTNYPFALASGLGLNAVVAFQLILGLGLPWQAAMGVVFLEGLLVTLLVLTGFRTVVMRAIPLALKRAISVGIGLFILFIGLNNAGLVRQGQGTPVTLGDLTTFPVLLATLGLLLTMLFVARGLRAAILLGVVATTLIGIAAHYALGADVTNAVPGVQGALPSPFPPPSFETIGQGLNVDVFRLVGVVTAVALIFSLMLSDFFDTMGTVIGVGEQAGFLTAAGELPGSDRVLLVDSLAAMVGGIFSASSVTTYIESAAGVAEGGRTGLTAVVTGVLFLLSILLAPIAGVVPAEATAPALIVVGFLMCGAIRDINFNSFAEGFPALLTMALMPFTYSITNGIGAGFIAYALIHAMTGRAREIHPLLWGAALAFVVYFLLPLLQHLFGF
ncbi:MAG TPA: NCS2 family permease [Roseiflexaceae bacterium]|nr:NCS2 family permease [Roseiflexaceae bacterium]